MPPRPTRSPAGGPPRPLHALPGMQRVAEGTDYRRMDGVIARLRAGHPAADNTPKTP